MFRPSASCATTWWTWASALLAAGWARQHEIDLGNALLAAPKHIIRVVAELTGTPEEKLLNDESIGLDGLVEIMTAWVEVNRLEDFMPAVRRLVEKVRTALGSSPQPNIGSNA